LNIALVAIHVIACLILIVVILLQAGRGQGLTGSSFSSGSVQSIFGTRAADFLTKATTVAAVLFLFTCIGLDILETRKSRSLFEEKRPAAPVDMEQIQKVLEKIKAEQEQKDVGTATTAPVPATEKAPEPTAEPEAKKT